jgi:hypothetical protein
MTTGRDEDMNGSGIFRFPNLADVRAHLHGGGYQYLEDLSYEERAGATLLTDPRHQPLGLTRAALNSGVRDREKVFRSAGYPPKVFVSYRWESAVIKDWVAQLGRHIERRGFHVFLDQDIDALQDNDPVEIGRYISVLVDCQIIVCVVTPQYAVGLGPRAWLFEERQLMNLLARRGATILRVLRDGQEPVPDTSSSPLDLISAGVSAGVSIEIPVPDHQGFTIDMRGAAAGQFSMIDRFFTYRGPQLPPEEDGPFRAWLDDVARILQSGDVRSAAAAFERGARYAATTEYRRLAAHIAAGRRDAHSAAQLALQALTDDNVSAETLIDLSLLLNELGEHRASLHGFSRLPWWLGEEWSWMVHFVQGDILDDLGSYVASLAHLQYAWALSAKVLIQPRPTAGQLALLRNTLGYVLLFRFGAPHAARPHLEAAWDAEPIAAHGVNLLLCCAALGDYSTAEQLWRATTPNMSEPEQERFAEIPARLAARTLGTPPAVAALPGSGPDSWECPRCAQQLVMSDTTFLCVGCGTAFHGTSCPCCASNLLAGAGRLTSAGEIPPKCPICNIGERMRRSTGQHATEQEIKNR